MVAATSTGDETKQPNLQHEIRDMLSTLTGRLTALGRSMASGSSRSQEGGPDTAAAADHGFGIITLAGDNRGASMKADMEELMDGHGGAYEDESGISTCANSNYQSVNNSILHGGSCTAEDPGVHIAISEYAEEEEEEEEEDDDDEHEDHEKKKKKKKEKKKGKKEKKKKKEKEESEEESEEKEKKKKKKKKKKDEEKKNEDEK